MPYKKILFTRPPTGRNPLQGGSGRDRHPQPPLGLASLAAGLHNTTEVLPILDGNFCDDYSQALKEVVEREKPDLVGFSAYTTFARPAMEGAGIVKSVDPSILTVMGGPHGTVLAQKTLERCRSLDVVARDEAEITIQDLVQGKPFESIEGIVWRRENTVVQNPPRPYVADLDTFPYPAYHLLPEFPNGYRPHPPKSTGKRWASALWSRGCPFHCTYCAREASFGLKYRCNTPDYVVGFLKHLHDKYAVEEVTFYDDVFTLRKDVTMTLMEALRPERLGFAFEWDAETRVDLVDPELLVAMRRAGCRAIAYGIEHGVFIKEIKGGRATLEQAEKAVRWTQQAGIDVIGYFMLGLPNETPETLQKTIDFALKLNPTYAQFAITTPFPGNELYKQALAAGLKELDSDWENYIYAGAGQNTSPVLATHSLSREDLSRASRKAYRSFYLRWKYIWGRLIQSLTSWRHLRMNWQGFRILWEMMG